MSALSFEEVAVRGQVWLRKFIFGPTGSGKSRGALEIATKLFGGELSVTLVNTERGRATLYADRYTYSLINLEDGDQSPETFVKAIDLAEQRNPGGVLVIDNVSHEWMGKNGVLQQADRFGDWKTVRPKHQAFVDRLMACQMHVIVCCRAKMKYEVSEEPRPGGGGGTRQVVRALGVGPTQDGDLQYEFNIVAQLEQESHEAVFSGHVDSLVGKVSTLVPGDEIAAALTKWLSEGEPIQPPAVADPEAVAALVALLTEEGIASEVIEEKFGAARLENRGQLHPAYVAEQTEKAQKRAAAKNKKAADKAEKEPTPA